MALICRKSSGLSLESFVYCVLSLIMVSVNVDNGARLIEIDTVDGCLTRTRFRPAEEQ